MERLSLRLRVFLLFAGLAAGALAMLAGGLWLGHARTGGDIKGYLIAGLVAGFGILGLVAGIWLLFDDNVAKPITRLAADLRFRAHSNVSHGIDGKAARYLGDLAPAARAVCERLGQDTLDAAERLAAETRHLSDERARLAAALSELPVAVLMLSQDHRITLYDGQAAAALDDQSPLCLGHPLSDYLDPAPVIATVARASWREGRTAAITVSTADGTKVFPAMLRPLGDGAGYLLALTVDPDTAAQRPLVYDFAILESQRTTGEAGTRLDALTFVVFDLETTGLNPETDEVVQIGAVRIVNGRRVDGETFDMLVNPGRPIPATSSKVHGITDEMVRDAPRLPHAAARFRAFARDAVLIAHNSPFDLAFLRREAAQAETEIANPVLDTVLMSAALFGAEAPHTLDAIADRLGIEIPSDLRHTALGDAAATAEILTKMIPVLMAKGIATLDDALKAMEAHMRIFGS